MYSRGKKELDFVISTLVIGIPYNPNLMKSHLNFRIKVSKIDVSPGA